MPTFFKLLIRSCLIGICLGWTILALFLLTNTGGMGDKVLHASDPYLGTFLLVFGFAITFGSVAMGVAIMSIPSDDSIEFEDDGADKDYQFPY